MTLDQPGPAATPAVHRCTAEDEGGDAPCWAHLFEEPFGWLPDQAVQDCGGQPPVSAEPHES